MNNTSFVRSDSLLVQTRRCGTIFILLRKDDDFPEGFRDRSGLRFGWVSTGCGQRNDLLWLGRATEIDCCLTLSAVHAKNRGEPFARCASTLDGRTKTRDALANVFSSSINKRRRKTRARVLYYYCIIYIIIIIVINCLIFIMIITIAMLLLCVHTYTDMYNTVIRENARARACVRGKKKER